MLGFTDKILSFCYRTILIVFSLLIVLNYENVFNEWIYFIGLILYSVIYIRLVNKDGLFSKIRLLNDSILIFLVIYSKQLDLVLFCYILLPILNSPNYTGKSKSSLLYFYFLINLYVLNDFVFQTNFIWITLLFGIINFLIDSRKRYFKNISELNESIESFFESQIELRKSYKIYNNLIKTLNRIKLIVFYTPKFQNIVCFKIDDQVKLLNSSKFVWTYELNVNEIDLESKNKFLMSNIQLKLNNENASKNFWILNKTASSKYLFCFVMENKSIPLFNLYYIGILNSITSRLSRIFDLEEKIKANNKFILDDFKKKYFQIKNAETAMHFIRNRINTFDNFIEMSKDCMNNEMDSDDRKLYEKELGNVERNFKLLLDRAESILSKGDKAFSSANSEIKSVNFLYELIREVWEDHFNNFNPENNWNKELISDCNISINTSGLYILLIDWLKNMQKYYNSENGVTLNETEKIIEIVFINDFKINELGEKQILVKDFNSVDKDRILSRTSHGLSIMKNIIEEMGLKGRMEIENNSLKFYLEFKKIL